MNHYSPLWCLIVCLAGVHNVCAYHFRGAIITWRSLPNNPGSIELNYRVAWKKDFVEYRFEACSPEDVRQETALHVGLKMSCGNWFCIDNIDYVCTDYNVAGDYAAGTGKHLIALPNGTTSFDISFSSCCWVYLQNYGTPRNYLLKATVDLTPRRNRGDLINSSPTASVIPVQLVQQGCNHVIRIPVSDPDGDYVRCRFANHSNNECDMVCGALANARIENSGSECLLIYNGQRTTSVGWYAVTIMIEDFNRRRSRRPLSRVPLHFLINVTVADNCHQPHFQEPTPENGECIPASAHQPLTIKLAARSNDVGYTMTGISTFGLPLGMEASALTTDPVDPLTSFVELRWVPRDMQQGPHQICFSAFDKKNNKEFASDQVCITVHVGALLAHPLPELSTPGAGQIVDVTNQEWEIRFNSTIMQHHRERGGIVVFARADNNEPVHMVNLALENNPDVWFSSEESDTVAFSTPGFYLQPETEYNFIVHEGAVRSDGICKSLSAMHEWRFRTGPNMTMAASRLPPVDIVRRVATAVPECLSSFMLIYVSKVWLASVSSLTDPAGMYLNDPSCVGEDFNETHFVLGAPHDMCGTVVESESSNVQTVQNTVHIPPQPVSQGTIITRDNNIVVHVTCRLSGAKVTHAQFDPNITTIVYYETGYGSFNFQLRMFHDEMFRAKYRPNNYPINVYQKQRLYFEAKVLSDDEMSVFLTSCRATPTANPRDPTHYIFIDEGCKVDETVEFHDYYDNSRKRFSIEAFAFLGQNLHGSVFIHCDLATCLASDTNSRCARGCVLTPSLVRRDTSQSGSSSSKAYTNTDGPIRIHTTKEDIPRPAMAVPGRFNYSLVELPMLTATILLLMVILGVLVKAAKIFKRSKHMTTMYPHRVDRVKLPSIKIGSE